MNNQKEKMDTKSAGLWTDRKKSQGPQKGRKCSDLYPTGFLGDDCAVSLLLDAAHLREKLQCL